MAGSQSAIARETEMCDGKEFTLNGGQALPFLAICDLWRAPTALRVSFANCRIVIWDLMGICMHKGHYCCCLVVPILPPRHSLLPLKLVMPVWLCFSPWHLVLCHFQVNALRQCMILYALFLPLWNSKNNIGLSPGQSIMDTKYK